MTTPNQPASNGDVSFYCNRIFGRLALLAIIVVALELTGCGGGEIVSADPDVPDDTKVAQERVVKEKGDEGRGIMQDLRDTRRNIVNIRKHSKDTLNKLSMRGSVDFEIQREYETIVAAYLACVKGADRPPKDWQELKRYCHETGKDSHPLKSAQKRGMKIVTDAPIDRRSAVGHGLNVLIAYEKSAAATEGWVLFADGNVAKVGPEKLGELTPLGQVE